MKNEAQTITHEIFYKILECCISSNPVSRGDIAKRLNITEGSLYFKQLTDTNLIKNWGENDYYFQLTPEGMSTFLNIQAQKQADKHARKATLYAIIAIFIASAALIANIIALFIH